MLSEDIIRADGTVGPVGQRFEDALPAQSGSGGLPPNWATLNLNTSAQLAPSGDSHAFTADELSFRSWYGDTLDVTEPNDFTIDTLDGFAVVRSERGGRFQVTAIIGSPTQPLNGFPDNPALLIDPVSDHTRYVWFGLAVGDQDEGNIGAIGLDGMVPILIQLQNGSSGTTFTSSIGYTPPGGVVLRQFGAALIGGVGDDNVPIDSLVGYVGVYQIG